VLSGGRFAGLQVVGRTCRFAQIVGRTCRFAQTGESADSPILQIFWTFVRMLTRFADFADLTIWRTPRTHTLLCVRENLRSDDFFFFSCIDLIWDDKYYEKLNRSDDLNEDLSKFWTQIYFLSLKPNFLSLKFWWTASWSSTNLMFLIEKWIPLGSDTNCWSR